MNATILRVFLFILVLFVIVSCSLGIVLANDVFQTNSYRVATQVMGGLTIAFAAIYALVYGIVISVNPDFS